MGTLNEGEIDARFKALADHNRRTIVRMVWRRPGVTLQEISAGFPISRFAVMNHINLVEKAGLIRSEKESIYRHFYPVPGATDELFENWKSTLEEDE